MRTKVKTTKIEMPRWQTDLFVGLFNGDGGGGFEDEEILQAQEFIKENNLLSMVEIEELGETNKCTFITDYGTLKTYIYVLAGKKIVKQYNEFGLLPYQINGNRGENLYFLRSFESEVEKNAYLQGWNDGNISDEAVIIEDVETMLNEWWCQLSDELQATFTILPENNPKDSLEFWNMLSFSDKVNIYNWYIIHTHSIPVDKHDLNSLRLEIISELAETWLSIQNNVSPEDLFDEDGWLLEDFHDDYNNMLDEIEDRITNYKYNEL